MARFTRVGLEVKGNSKSNLEGEFETGSWHGVKIDEEFALFTRDGTEEHGLTGFGYCESDMLVGLLFGIVRKRFTGVLNILVNYNTKSLYFDHGELVFAKSSLIDDRLGEVMYREGQITLEKMAGSAVEVTRERKFGQVLLESGEYNSTDLWDFLKLQVKEIFQSLFLSDGVYYSLSPNAETPVISVILEQSTERLIQSAASFSQMFRGFKSRVELDSKISLSMDISEISVDDGTYLADIIELISRCNTISELLESSKLSADNTLINLLRMVVRQYVEIEHLEDNVSVAKEYTGSQRELKGCIDSYHVVLKTAVNAFNQENVAFPFEDLDRFVNRLYDATMTPVFLKADGMIASESVRNLYEKGRGSIEQQEEIIWGLRGLIQFVLQVTGDLLPGGFAIKKSIQEMLA